MERSLLGDAAEKSERLVELRGHRGEAIVALHLVDIGEVVGGDISCGWSGDHDVRVSSARLIGMGKWDGFLTGCCGFP